LFAHVRGPVAIAGEVSGSGYNHCSEAQVISILYLFSFGDASTAAAKAAGSEHPELVHVTHVDYSWTHVLGTGVYKIRVCFFDPARAGS
jgi:hypothetical protein